MDLEQQVIATVHAAIGDAISKCLSGYNSPLEKFIIAAVEMRGDVIKSIVDDAFADALAGDLREGLRQEMSHKLAKILVSKMEGEIEKRVNDLRSNPSSKAAITLAVEKAIASLK